MTQIELELQLKQLATEQLRRQNVLDSCINEKQQKIREQELKLNILRDTIYPEINQLKLEKKRLAHEYMLKELEVFNEFELKKNEN